MKKPIYLTIFVFLLQSSNMQAHDWKTFLSPQYLNLINWKTSQVSILCGVCLFVGGGISYLIQKYVTQSELKQLRNLKEIVEEFIGKPLRCNSSSIYKIPQWEEILEEKEGQIYGKKCTMQRVNIFRYGYFYDLKRRIKQYELLQQTIEGFLGPITFDSQQNMWQCQLSKTNVSLETICQDAQKRLNQR